MKPSRFYNERKPSVCLLPGNGTRSVQSCRCGRNLIQVRLLSGPCKDSIFCVPRINLHSTENTDGDLPFTRRQYPLRLAFVMTINKAQGQTFDRIGLWLPSPVFAHEAGCFRFLRHKHHRYVGHDTVQ